ncbi:MAG: thiolase family protein [Bacteriovoracaceae bacterium]|jgi:acetyl-CoA C-acetyltransferase|nr:thiolase family protein [Bacteriovoracaceae bacterium]
MSVYILSGARTPLGSFMGSLSTVSAPKLGAVAIKEALRKANVSTSDVDEVFMGNVITAGVGQAPARQAALFASIDESTPCTTINKVCGSGLKTILLGAQTIKCGDNKIVVAGGMENMSMAPHLVPGSRNGFRFGNVSMLDSMQNDGLWDVYSDRPMGSCAEECAQKYGFTREQQDQFSIESFTRAQAAQKSGAFSDEIAKVSVKTRKAETIVDCDEGPSKANFEKMKTLRAAFEKNGTITAANASTINDGAAAVVLGNDEKHPCAEFEILSYGSFAQNPTWFTTAPVEAMKIALDRAGKKVSEIDLFEINEAFALVTMAAMKDLEIEHSKVNIYGGAVSLGHPIGCSGTRIVVTLMNAMKRENKRLGMAGICIGGGEALALIVRRR